jgi:N utilization substance protein B
MADPKASPPQPAPARASRQIGRSRAREFALQALYQHLVGRNDADSIDPSPATWPASTRPTRCTTTPCCTAASKAENAGRLILPLLDRKHGRDLADRACRHVDRRLRIPHCLDVPWRVVINECIELAKEFGGTDGHKYVNGVLNGLAPKLRAAEVAADKAAPAGKAGREDLGAPNASSRST